jgi:hypothetical protein
VLVFFFRLKADAMFYALVYYPALNDSRIQGFREKYDPYSDLIMEHVTLIYPVPDEIQEDLVKRHLHHVLQKWKPFKTVLKGLGKTWDNWLYLKVQEGNNQFERLHEQLYSDILRPYKREDIPYEPMVGLGLFSLGTYDPLEPEKLQFDTGNYEKALQYLKSLDLSYTRIMNQLTLVKMNNEFTHLWELETYYLV